MGGKALHIRAAAMALAGLVAALLGLGLEPLHAREMMDEAGRWVRVPPLPRRVVSLAPSITECLFALGLDEEVVGVTQYSNYPPKVASLPQVGSYVHLNLERILALRPDLVLATRDGNPRDQVERLAKMGMTVYTTDPRSLDGLFRTLEAMGEIFRREERAAGIVREMKARLARVESLVNERPRPRVFLQIDIHPLVTVGKGTLQNHLIELAGGENVAATESIQYPILSMERILETRPEVILVSSMVADSAQELRRWRKWREIPAVAKGRLHMVDADLIDRPSPRVLDGLEEMVRLIHPEVSAGLNPGKSGW